MSAPEKSLRNFLQRWSRRKLAVTECGGRAKAADAAETAEPPAPADAPPRHTAAAEFDPASLPPIESINAASDIRPFLAANVPADLTRAALRRAWVSDPTIRDFVGLAENQWDFTKAEGVPGFGSLDPAPELRRRLVSLLSDSPAVEAYGSAEAPGRGGGTGEKANAAPPEQAVPAPLDSAAASSAPAPSQSAQVEEDDAAMRDDSAGAKANTAPAQRKHGRALPT